MTENDLHKRPEFAGLPIYGKADARCEDLLCCRDPAYDGTIHEAGDDVHFWKLLQDAQLESKGAIRYSPDDVRAVFWRKRGDA